MKLLVNRRPVSGPWGGGNAFTQTLFYQAPTRGIDVYTTYPAPLADAILVIDPREDELRISYREIIEYKRVWRDRTKLVFRINECDARKGEQDVIDPLIRKVGEHADHCIFISEWLRDHHFERGFKTSGKVSVIHNGHLSHFKPIVKEKREGPIKVVTHHWSNNFRKGHAMYAAIDDWIKHRDDFEFTYIGRPAARFSPRTKVVGPLWGPDLAQELASHDVYITGSLHDPGPNHVAEAIACGLPTYVYAEGGGGVEMAGHSHVFNSTREMLNILGEKNYKLNSTTVRPWEEVIEDYLDILTGKTTP